PVVTGIAIRRVFDTVLGNFLTVVRYLHENVFRPIARGDGEALPARLFWLVSVKFLGDVESIVLYETRHTDSKITCFFLSMAGARLASGVFSNSLKQSANRLCRSATASGSVSPPLFTLASKKLTVYSPSSPLIVIGMGFFSSNPGIPSVVMK